jgi:hypothetical protein
VRAQATLVGPHSSPPQSVDPLEIMQGSVGLATTVAGVNVVVGFSPPLWARLRSDAVVR